MILSYDVNKHFIYKLFIKNKNLNYLQSKFIFFKNYNNFSYFNINILKSNYCFYNKFCIISGKRAIFGFCNRFILNKLVNDGFFSEWYIY